MPRRLTMSSVDAIARHGIEELRLGLPVEHVLRQTALMGALVGRGASATAAIRAVEAREAELVGLPRGEELEAFHVGVRGVPGRYGYRMPAYTGVPYGWQTQAPYYAGIPTSAGMWY